MYIWFLYNIYRLESHALWIACVLLRSCWMYEWMNVFIYYKTRTIHLRQHCGNYFPKNYQFTLSGSWQVFAVATCVYFRIRDTRRIIQSIIDHNLAYLTSRRSFLGNNCGIIMSFSYRGKPKRSQLFALKHKQKRASRENMTAWWNKSGKGKGSEDVQRHSPCCTTRTLFWVAGNYARAADANRQRLSAADAARARRLCICY